MLELGAHRAVDTLDTKEIESLAGQFDFIISTVATNLDWNAYAMALNQKGTLVHVGAILPSLDASNLPLIMGQRSISGSAVGSPGTIAAMLDFAARHDIKPVIEKYSFDDINPAISRLRSGETRYRVVLCR